MWLMLLTASHVTQQCEKSACIATRLTADHSKVRCGAVRTHQTLPLSHRTALAMSVMCQPCPCRWSAGDNAAWNALYSSPARPFILLQYQVSWRVIDPRGRSPHYGAKRPSVPSSADIICLMEKFMAHILTYCDPHISRTPHFEGAKLSQIFLLVFEYTRSVNTVLITVAVQPETCTVTPFYAQWSDRTQNMFQITSKIHVHNGNDVTVTVWGQCREHCWGELSSRMC